LARDFTLFGTNIVNIGSVPLFLRFIASLLGIRTTQQHANPFVCWCVRFVYTLKTPEISRLSKKIKAVFIGVSHFIFLAHPISPARAPKCARPEHYTLHFTVKK
jgi:hypothetical protein